jgi:hypothetical protein
VRTPALHRHVAELAAAEAISVTETGLDLISQPVTDCSYRWDLICWGFTEPVVIGWKEARSQQHPADLSGLFAAKVRAAFQVIKARKAARDSHEAALAAKTASGG